MVPANSWPSMSGILGELEPADLVAVHFVRAVGETDGARVRVGTRELEVLAQSSGPVRLDRPVGHLAGRVGGSNLDHGDVGARRLVAHGVHEPGGLVDQ